MSQQDIKRHAKNLTKSLDGMIKGLDSLYMDTLKQLNPEQSKLFAEHLKKANLNSKIDELKKEQEKVKKLFDVD